MKKLIIDVIKQNLFLSSISQKTPNPKIAQIIMSQYGGPDGEMGASMRYLSQRFTAPNRIVAGVLNDIGRSVSLLRILWLVLL